jgi:hypothetical protein
MSYCDEFGYALRATVVYLVIRYGPLHGMQLYSKNICNDFSAWGHSTGFGCALQAITQYLLCAMGRSAGFGYALWVVAKDLVMCYGQ